MKFNHQYLGYESEDQRDVFSCSITDVEEVVKTESNS